jgi:hypothetical protein
MHRNGGWSLMDVDLITTFALAAAGGSFASAVASLATSTWAKRLPWVRRKMKQGPGVHNQIEATVTLEDGRQFIVSLNPGADVSAVADKIAHLLEDADADQGKRVEKEGPSAQSPA